LLFRGLRKIWHPAMYQGKAVMKGYFEGWYYKLADKRESRICALIPGVSFDKEGRHPQAFIQFLDDAGASSHFFSYEIDKFSFSRNTPEIRIGESSFSPAGIKVDIAQNSARIKGTLDFKNITPWPVSLFSPGAMGWYAFVPLMECYHGVLSFDHLIEGQLEINGKSVDFSGGRGYIEKDWGRSFPGYHIWVQTNHFDQPGVSLMVSIANIPWLGKSFDGFLIGLWYAGRLYRFTTYTRAGITFFQYDQEKLLVHVQSSSHRLEIEVSYIRGAPLRTPVTGEMQGRLSESLTAQTRIRFYLRADGKESLVYQGTGRHSGLEIEGKVPLKLNTRS
jgi:tocopherol cyclase